MSEAEKPVSPTEDPSEAEKASAPSEAKWKKYISNPTVQGILSVAAIIIGIVFSLALWWFTRSTIDPVYMVLGSEIVAEKRFPRLTVQWDGQPVGNLCVSKVGIWNEGNTPIRADQFIQSNPFRIVSTTARILHAEQIHGSRPDFRLTAAIGEPSVVILRVEGNEAFEKYDGVVFRIFHTGTNCSTSSFRVEGRIIGHPVGFADYSKYVTASFQRVLYMSIIVMIVMTITVSITTVRRKKDLSLRHQLYLSVFMLIVILFLVILFVPASVLPWMPNEFSAARRQAMSDAGPTNHLLQFQRSVKYLLIGR